MQLAGLEGADAGPGADGRGKKKADGPGANFFQKKKENLEDRARIAELRQSIEGQEQQIFIHKLEISSLKEQVVKLLEEKHYQSAVQLSAQFLNQNAQQPAGLPDEGLQMMSAINPQLYGEQQPLVGAGGEQPAVAMVNGQMMQQDPGAAMRDGSLENIAPQVQEDGPAVAGQDIQEAEQDATQAL